MKLTRLHGENFRNLANVSLNLDDSVNLLFGSNGSGKTSLLEAVYVLSTGRSFRGVKIDPITRQGSDHYLVSGELSSPVDGAVSLGVRRDTDGSRILRINGAQESRMSEFARHLPTLVLGPDSVELLRGPPPERRKFLNQGVFHVEPSFNELWRQGVRALQQRNNLLRQDRSSIIDIEPWTFQLTELCERIHEQRENYFERFLPVFTETYRFLLDLEGVKCTYRKGWDSSRSLAEVYQGQLESDRQRKYTQSGFQRADIRFTCGGDPVSQVCSRGELKLLAWSAILAQGLVLSELSAKPIYLVDDLIAELDIKHQKAVASLLERQGGQVLATGTDENLLKALWSKGYGKLFHVEQGSITELEVTK